MIDVGWTSWSEFEVERAMCFSIFESGSLRIGLGLVGTVILTFKSFWLWISLNFEVIFYIWRPVDFDVILSLKSCSLWGPDDLEVFSTSDSFYFWSPFDFEDLLTFWSPLGYLKSFRLFEVLSTLNTFWLFEVLLNFWSHFELGWVALIW